MKIININKNKAFNRLRTSFLINFFIYGMIFGILFTAFNYKLQSWVSTSVMVTFLLISSWELFKIYRYIRTLEQSFDISELRTSWCVILENIHVARLQVINTIEINQSLLDKLFKIYNLNVNYGLGDNGYNHQIKFLNKEQAEEISRILKPNTNLGILLNKNNTGDKE